MAKITEGDGGKRRMEVALGQGVMDFEIAALRRNGAEALLPRVILERDGCVSAAYDMTGCLTLRDYPFEDMDRALEVLWRVPLCLAGAEDRLLSADKFLLDCDSVCVEVGTRAVRLAYGPERRDFRARYEELLAFFGGFGHIVGLRAATVAIAERMRGETPDLLRLAHIVEDVRREWHVIRNA